jgi:hypothetical protein
MDSFKDEFGNDLPRNLHHFDGMVSLVVLSKTFFSPTVETLRTWLDEVYPAHFFPEREDGSFVVAGEGSPAPIFLSNRWFRAPRECSCC